MEIRTDLAIESDGMEQDIQEGVDIRRYPVGNIRMTCVEIQTPQAARRIGKPMGRYVTAEGMDLTEDFRNVREHIEGLGKEIAALLPPEGMVLVVGLGNRAITADALGPESIRHILATRHIHGELAAHTGLSDLRSVATVVPGVLGETGMEASEMVGGLVERLHPAAMIVIDALAARNIHRLGTTVQIGNTGIAPGSGVGNHRRPLNEEVFGIPVIAAGVPMVVDAATLAFDLLHGKADAEQLWQEKPMTVTPRNIDVLTDRAAKLIGMAVNCALQPQYDFDTLAALVS